MTASVKAFLDRLYCLEAFDKDDRAVWMGVHEALGLKYAAVIAVCEQQSEEDMGFTEEGMSKTLEALGYRVIDRLKVLHVFTAGQINSEKHFLDRAAKAGEKMVKTIRLREKIRDFYGRAVK